MGHKKLKIKIKSLAEEVRIIKHEERKVNPKTHRMKYMTEIMADLSRRGIDSKEEIAKIMKRARTAYANRERKAWEADNFDEFFHLRDHRLLKVRPALRASHLAYAFLRDKEYGNTEAKCHEDPNWEQVRRIVENFSYEHSRYSRKNSLLGDQLFEWFAKSFQFRDESHRLLVKSILKRNEE